MLISDSMKIFRITTIYLHKYLFYCFLLISTIFYFRDNGLNRIGNLLVPNDNYCLFEDWLMPILDELLEEQKSKVKYY